MKRSSLILLLVCLILFLTSCGPAAGVQPPTTQQHTSATPAATATRVSLTAPTLYNTTLNGLDGLDSRTGKVIWRNPAIHSFTPAVVSSTTVYVNDGLTLFAVDTHQGTTRWQNTYRTNTGTTSARLLVGKNGVYIIADTQDVAAVNFQPVYYQGSSGKLPPSPLGITFTTPFALQIPLSSGPQSPVVIPSTLYAFNPSTGNLLWKQTLSYELNDPVIDGDTIYGINGDTTHGMLYALNGMNGAVLWQHPLVQPGLYHSLFINAGVLYCAQSDQVHASLYAFSLHNGQQLWHSAQSINDDVYSNITFAGSMLYVVDSSNQLYAFNTRNGKLVWSHIPSASSAFDQNTFDNGVILASNGLLYLSLSSTSNVEPSPLQLLALNSTTGATVWSTLAPQGNSRFDAFMIQQSSLYLSIANITSGQSSIFIFDTTTGKLSTSYALPPYVDSGKSLTLVP